MKAMKTLLVAALATAGMAVTADVQAQRSGHTWSGSRMGGHSGSHWGGYGYRGWYGPRLGLYIGAPILWSSWYWGGYPYYDYYGPRVIYRDVEPYPASYPEGYIEPAPTTDIGPRTQGAPAQAPAYLNYCDSAKAYFPKVTSCPEGWRFEPTR